MATSPFAGVGLSQFGNEMTLANSSNSSLSEPLEGFKKVLMTKGIKASGFQDFLNGLGGKPVVPPSSTDVGVNPYQNTGMPASQPDAMSYGGMGATGVEAGAAEALHPEIASTLLTALF
jgi:hypothetical protein